MPTNAEYRELVNKMVDLFCQFKEQAMREIQTEPNAPPPPGRVWECHQPFRGDGTDCGRSLSLGGIRDLDNGTPYFWHPECWSAYQIKELRRMLNQLMLVRMTNAQGYLRDSDSVWQVVRDQLAELYPEQKETP